MDIEKAIDEVADNYAKRGYTVITRPTSDDLPPFAKSFHVQVVGRMRDIGVLVVIKRNREEFAADPEMDRYAEITSGQPGWRFDFVLLEGSGMNQEIQGAQEPTDDQLKERIVEVERLLDEGELTFAYMSAWATAEAGMRRLLRISGQSAGWGTAPRQMLNELVSNGLISMDEFEKLQEAFRLRNVLVHGFMAGKIDHSDVTFLLDLANRFIAHSVDDKVVM